MLIKRASDPLPRSRKRASLKKRAASDPGPNRSRSRSSQKRVKRASRSRKRASSSKAVCGICMEPILHDFGKTNCGHRFHNHCVCPWFKKSHNCPLCRQKVPAKDIKRLCEIIYKNPYASFIAANRSWFDLKHFVGTGTGKLHPRRVGRFLPDFIARYTKAHERLKALYRQNYKKDPIYTVIVG